jgi:hypothetical protein
MPLASRRLALAVFDYYFIFVIHFYPMRRSIVALIVVMIITSCSNKGFLRQRYTHFGHSSRHVAASEKRHAPAAVPPQRPVEVVSVQNVVKDEPGTLAGQRAVAVAPSVSRSTPAPSVSRAPQSNAPLKQAAQARSKDNGSTVSRNPFMYIFGDLLGMFAWGPQGTVISLLIMVAMFVLIAMLFA